MENKKKILVIGSANIDLTMSMNKLPEVGETVIDDGGVAYIPGGKGANAAIALHRLGAEVVFCTKLGADMHGQKLYSFYKEEGLDTSYIKVDREMPTGLAVVMRDLEGNNRIVVYPGANSTISQECIAESFDCAPDAVYLGFEIPFNMVVYAANLASERNIPIFIDAAPANRDFELEALPPVELFSPNETETLEFTGVSPTSMDNTLRAAIAILRRVKAKNVVIKQGTRGAFYYDGKGYYNTFPTVRVDKTVDTTAAGDAFTAAMTLEYLRSGDVKSAIKYGNVAGAITVTRPGASSSIPTFEEVEAYIHANKI